MLSVCLYSVYYNISVVQLLTISNSCSPHNAMQFQKQGAIIGEFSLTCRIEDKMGQHFRPGPALIPRLNCM